MPSGSGKYSAHDVNAFLSQVPDEFIELVRQAFPGMTDIEIVTLLLDGNDTDMENLVSSTGRVYTPTSGSSLQAQPLVPKGDWKESPPLPVAVIKRPQFRNAAGPPYLNWNIGKGKMEWAQNRNGRNSEEPGKDAQSPVEEPQLALEVAPTPLDPEPEESRREQEPDLSVHIQGAPKVPGWSLAAELAAMSHEDIQAVQEVMASLGLPDITTGSLPTDFDPSSVPPEIAEIAEMLARQLEPGDGGHQEPPVPLIQPVPAEVKVESAVAAEKEVIPEEETQFMPDQSKILEQHAVIKAIVGGSPPSSTPQNQLAHKPAAPTLTATHSHSHSHTPKPPYKTQTAFPIPPDLRSLIPPRPRSQIPSYPENQLPTPHNPVYSYDVSLLHHIDPYLFLDPTNPANPLTKTHLGRISRFPELPDAHTRQDLNMPKCANVARPVDSQNAKFTDCARAISNISVPKNLPQSHPDFYSYTSTASPPLLPPLSSHVVSEFGTCHVLARNANGKATTAELDKVKYLAGRVLRECSEQQSGSWRDRRTRTVGGTIGYLFVNEDIGGWDTVEVVLERAVY